ncbi:Lar family restriction alleviation protein [Pseudomonas tohonis]|uniref:Lar family restriction alleviation protein n=1 Tax=Pseudomonas tohonis TaxID=2725477 RepID=UPI001F2EFD62|nr:Lar family restriction alleviation protein [Pseudomonas tohonis]
MNEPNLLPCPHCGGEPQELQHDCQFWIQCTKCHGASAQTCVHTSEAEAVAAWNKRFACVTGSPESWSDAQVIEFLAVALRHVNVSGDLTPQDIRDGFRFMSSKNQRGNADGPGAYWVAVPWQITADMVVAFAETWYRKRRSFDDPEMDDAYTAMLQAAPAPPLAIQVSRVPAGLYRELGALRDLRDHLKSYSQRFLRDEMEDRDSCINDDQHVMASGLAQALAEAFAKEWKGSAAADHGERPVSLESER